MKATYSAVNALTASTSSTNFVVHSSSANLIQFKPKRKEPPIVRFSQSQIFSKPTTFTIRRVYRHKQKTLISLGGKQYFLESRLFNQELSRWVHSRSFGEFTSCDQLIGVEVDVDIYFQNVNWPQWRFSFHKPEIKFQRKVKKQSAPPPPDENRVLLEA